MDRNTEGPAIVSRDVLRRFRMFSCLPYRSLYDFGVDLFTSWTEDNVPRLGAALAFYSALSLAPLIVVVVGVAGLAFGKEAIQGQLVWEIQDTVGYDGARAIQDLLKNAHQQSSGTLATVLGLITLFFGATSVVVELTDALNAIWHVPIPPTNGWMGVLRLLRQRFVSFAMVLGVGFLLLVSLVTSAWLTAMGAFVNKVAPLPVPVLHVFNFVVSFVVVMLLFAAIYKVLPAIVLQWSDVAIGAAVTSLLFTLGKFLIGLYLGRTSLASTYGAAGSFVVVLVWVYYSAQIFFLGAEFTRVYTLRYGSRFQSQLKVTPDRPDAAIIIDPANRKETIITP